MKKLKINQSSCTAHLVCLPLWIRFNYNSFETKWQGLWSKIMTNVYSMIQLNIFYVKQSCFQKLVCKINRTILQNARFSGVYSGRVHMTYGPGRCFDLWKAGKLPGSGPAVLDDVIELFSGRKYRFTLSADDAQCLWYPHNPSLTQTSHTYGLF